ncbi:MAG: type II toxin-antitoxin system HicB family antitoxin [Oscillospiraceae bacterium]|jgi:predicted RNase H-like HicB family nuclease|nr:type II toxin-antitoxin system HicB family antitoxin [Oscillospiraceae bacterium]
MNTKVYKSVFSRMSEYSVLIQYDSNDNIYIASIPELNGCMAHGKTREDATKEINIALEMWIEELIECGMEIPKPILFAS